MLPLYATGSKRTPASIPAQWQTALAKNTSQILKRQAGSPVRVVGGVGAGASSSNKPLGSLYSSPPRTSPQGLSMPTREKRTPTGLWSSQSTPPGEVRGPSSLRAQMEERHGGRTPDSNTAHPRATSGDTAPPDTATAAVDRIVPQGGVRSQRGETKAHPTRRTTQPTAKTHDDSAPPETSPAAELEEQEEAPEPVRRLLEGVNIPNYERQHFEMQAPLATVLAGQTAVHKNYSVPRLCTCLTNHSRMVGYGHLNDARVARLEKVVSQLQDQVLELRVALMNATVPVSTPRARSGMRANASRITRATSSSNSRSRKRPTTSSTKASRTRPRSSQKGTAPRPSRSSKTRSTARPAGSPARSSKRRVKKTAPSSSTHVGRRSRISRARAEMLSKISLDNLSIFCGLNGTQLNVLCSPAYYRWELGVTGPGNPAVRSIAFNSVFAPYTSSDGEACLSVTFRPLPGSPGILLACLKKQHAAELGFSGAPVQPDDVPPKLQAARAAFFAKATLSHFAFQQKLKHRFEVFCVKSGDGVAVTRTATQLKPDSGATQATTPSESKVEQTSSVEGPGSAPNTGEVANPKSLEEEPGRDTFETQVKPDTENKAAESKAGTESKGDNVPALPDLSVSLEEVNKEIDSVALFVEEHPRRKVSLISPYLLHPQRLKKVVERGMKKLTVINDGIYYTADWIQCCRQRLPMVCTLSLQDLHGVPGNSVDCEIGFDVLTAGFYLRAIRVSFPRVEFVNMIFERDRSF